MAKANVPCLQITYSHRLTTRQLVPNPLVYSLSVLRRAGSPLPGALDLVPLVLPAPVTPCAVEFAHRRLLETSLVLPVEVKVGSPLVPVEAHLLEGGDGERPASFVEVELVIDEAPVVLVGCVPYSAAAANSKGVARRPDRERVAKRRGCQSSKNSDVEAHFTCREPECPSWLLFVRWMAFPSVSIQLLWRPIS
jgi:hypothetical protein